MISRNWEDWAMGLSIAAAAAFALTMNSARGPAIAGDAVAAEPADYVMTITAKRLPAHCKGLSQGAAMPADCAAILDGATISVRENP